MGLFDVFSKGGKYFGKSIEPKCEYCEFGKRSSNGDKVLCTKKGMVDASFHCPKFVYSPLKRIPVKQLERVGWLEGDYDEKEDAEQSAMAEEKETGKKTAATTTETKTPAPAVTPVPATAPTVAPAPKLPTPSADLASLAAMAEAAGEYAPDAADAPQDDTTTETATSATDTASDDMPTLSSM